MFREGRRGSPRKDSAFFTDPQQGTGSPDSGRYTPDYLLLRSQGTAASVSDYVWCGVYMGGKSVHCVGKVTRGEADV